MIGTEGRTIVAGLNLKSLPTPASIVIESFGGSNARVGDGRITRAKAITIASARTMLTLLIPRPSGTRSRGPSFESPFAIYTFGTDWKIHNESSSHRESSSGPGLRVD